MSKHPNTTTKTRKPKAPRYSGSTITLDGQPARLDMPREGVATVTAMGTTRRLRLDRDDAQQIIKSGGAFVSPTFARPRATA